MQPQQPHDYRILSLPPLRVYLDDLERIVAVLGELSRDVVITSERCSVAFVDELARAHEQPFTRVTIATAGKSPRLSVELAPNRAEVVLSDKEHTLGRGVQERIEALLLQARRPVSQATGPWLPAITTLAVAAIVSQRGGRIDALLVGVIATAIWVGWWLLLRDVTTRHYSVIVPEYSEQAATFYERNRERVDLAVASGASGAVLGVVLAVLVQSLL